LRDDEGAHVERVMRRRGGADWVDTDDFTVSVEGNRRAIQVAGVAHSALEYYRWAVRSQVRAEGRRFAAAVARLPTVPVLQVHGADDPFLLAATAAVSWRWGGPHLRSEVLPGTGHFPHAERPDVTTSLLLDFLLK
jgi:pimeloyl-ACP methyl ester carboxylesterase